MARQRAGTGGIPELIREVIMPVRSDLAAADDRRNAFRWVSLRALPTWRLLSSTLSNSNVQTVFRNASWDFSALKTRAGDNGASRRIISAQRQFLGKSITAFATSARMALQHVCSLHFCTQAGIVSNHATSIIWVARDWLPP